MMMMLSIFIITTHVECWYEILWGLFVNYDKLLFNNKYFFVYSENNGYYHEKSMITVRLKNK